MKRYFDGELLVHSIRDSNIPHDNNEGGFLVPEYIPCDKPGLRARLLRFIGRLMRNEDIYSKGIEMVNFHKYLKDGTRIVKCKRKIS